MFRSFFHLEVPAVSLAATAVSTVGVVSVACAGELLDVLGELIAIVCHLIG